MSATSVRPATIEDAAMVAGIYARAGVPVTTEPAIADPATSAGIALLLQTGHIFFLAERDGAPLGAVRFLEDEGITTFDLLVSLRHGAGRALTFAIDNWSKDHGIRLVRATVPDSGAIPDLFGRWGYLPIARTIEPPSLLLEKRLPLLTVREQRRADAAAIGALAGIDPWPFEQGARPGWFVLADGDRITGVVSVATDRQGLATVAPPIVSPGYTGRGLELWMLERAANHAQTNGAHSAQTPMTLAWQRTLRELEGRGWFPEGDMLMRRRAPAIELERPGLFDD